MKNKKEEDYTYDDFYQSGKEIFAVEEDVEKEKEVVYDDDEHHEQTEEEYENDFEEDEETLITRLKKEGKVYNKNYNYQDIPINMENFEPLANKYKPAILAGVKRVQKMYGHHPSLDKDDLFQEGMLALYKSIEKFNPEKGVFFGYYLKAAINNSLKTHCRNFLPHKYVKDAEKTELEGKQKFKRMAIDVGTLDDGNSYLL